MRQTSLDTYGVLIDSGKLAVMEQWVYETMKYCFEGNPVTAKEIMQYYGVTDPNHVRPRISDLQKKGLVEAHGRIGNQMLWKVIK